MMQDIRMFLLRTATVVLGLSTIILAQSVMQGNVQILPGLVLAALSAFATLRIGKIALASPPARKKAPPLAKPGVALVRGARPAGPGNAA